MTDGFALEDMAEERSPAPTVPRPAPMVLPTVGLALGIVLERFAPVPVFWHYGILGAAFVTLAAGRRGRECGVRGLAD